jgi:hypothetical protein
MEILAKLLPNGIEFLSAAEAELAALILMTEQAISRRSESIRAAVVYRARRLVVRGLQITGLNRLASQIYYKHMHGFKSASPGLDKGFEDIFRKSDELGLFGNGDIYCEFGLFKGYSFWKAQSLANERGLNDALFYGFDSFMGLPEVVGIDATENNDFRRGQYACSESQVRKNLTEAGVDWNRTKLFKGFFADSLTQEFKRELHDRRIGIAMIDCDLYEATVDVLAWLEDVVTDRMILIMDDWNCFGKDDNRGQRRALRELMERKPGWTLEPIAAYGLNSQAFVLRAPAAALR